MKTASERLMIVRLKLSKWEPRKFDKAASDQLAQMHGQRDADEIGRFNKKLLMKSRDGRGKRESLTSIGILLARYWQLRGDHYRMTAPWADDGVRVLPADMYFDYVKLVNDAKDEIDRLAEDFFAEYPTLVAHAKSRLNGADDYPSIGELRRKFKVDVHFEPLPNPDDVRVWGISDQAAAEIARDMRARVEESMKAAQATIIERLVESCRAFIDKTRQYELSLLDDIRRPPSDKRFDGAIENLRDVVKLVINGLNITADQQLASIVNALDSELAGLTLDQMKGNSTIRAEKLDAVEKSLAKFAGVFGGKK